MKADALVKLGPGESTAWAVAQVEIPHEIFSVDIRNYQNEKLIRINGNICFIL